MNKISSSSSYDPDLFEQFSFDNSYYIELEPSPWIEAQSYAEELGGNLVSINSKEEQEFIYKTFILILSNNIK